MGHRHLLSTSQMFESDHDQNWNHMQTEQSYGHIVGPGSADNGSFFYPTENMLVDGMHFSSHWSAPRPSGYSSSSHSVEIPHYPSDGSGPSHDPFQHPSSVGTFGTVAENYTHHASSSNYDRQAFHGVEGSFVDLTMGNGRGPHKRKSPGIPSSLERGGTSRYYGAGSSSEIPIPSELQHEKVGLDTQHMPWDHISMNPNYRGNGLSIRGDGSMRNVRSRPAHDLESNLARTHLSSNPSHSSYPINHPIDHPSTMDLSGQASTGLAQEWNHISVPSSHGRILPDTSVFNHEPGHFLLGTNSSNEGYHHDFIPSRAPAAPQSYPGSTSSQSVRGVRSSFSQRSSPAFRASSSSLRLGHTPPPSEESLQLVAESYSRHPRPLSHAGWRNSERTGRLRISNERYRLLAEEAGLHDRFTSEGLMVVDRSALYGSRSMLDQHREMRLDVDNMSYEELLALGERIGTVNTGLSDELMPKCVTETIYCSSDQIQDEGSCVICLEEYKNMDDVGTLKTCGHDYHVSCIKKWLAMKNSCPICKGPALPDNMKAK